MSKGHGFSLSEFCISIGLVGLAFGLLRGAVYLVGWTEDSALPGIMALGSFSLLGAVAGNNIAVLTLGRDHAIEGVILGGALLSPPLMLLYIQWGG